MSKKYFMGEIIYWDNNGEADPHQILGNWKVKDERVATFRLFGSCNTNPNDLMELVGSFRFKNGSTHSLNLPVSASQEEQIKLAEQYLISIPE